jgi:hypothetical protein
MTLIVLGLGGALVLGAVVVAIIVALVHDR